MCWKEERASGGVRYSNGRYMNRPGWHRGGTEADGCEEAGSRRSDCLLPFHGAEGAEEVWARKRDRGW
ncbi:Uncharacterized protein HZ326_19002 [Fusarium oxysporum f. sp. albedinis]|nr:Uncharacterized protein HZ326_19002 [Fusarium oxysporum f. sp. albedinis]